MWFVHSVPTMERSDILAGSTFLLIGLFHEYPRDALAGIIKSHGGVVKNVPSAKVLPLCVLNFNLIYASLFIGGARRG